MSIVKFSRGSYPDSYFLFPKKIDGIPVSDSQIDSALDSLSAFRYVDFLKSLGVAPPKGLTPPQEEQWYKVTAASLQPVRSPDHRGINFKYYDQTNPKPYLLKIKPFSSTDKNIPNIPFFVDFEDLAKPEFLDEFKKKYGMKVDVKPMQWKKPGEQ